MVYYNRSPIPQQFENRFEAFEEAKITSSSLEQEETISQSSESPDGKEETFSKDTFSASSSGSSNNMVFILLILLLFDAF